jgi:hypothetical protein
MPAKLAGPADTDNPIFQDEDKAREHPETLRWPSGPFAPIAAERRT